MKVRNAQLTNCLTFQLFSASSVIESRAATDVGQNVKLLTYVNVFYMPVTACATIWSINEDYGIVTFAVVTSVVAVLTYIVVANLNNFVHAGKTAFRALESKIVRDMVDDHDEYWAGRGAEFKQFRPDRLSIIPSKWLLLGYLLSKLTQSRRRPQKEADADGETGINN